jgi:hypothetical protein
LPKKKYVKNIPVKEDEHYGMTDFISLMAAHQIRSKSKGWKAICFYPQLDFKRNHFSSISELFVFGGDVVTKL